MPINKVYTNLISSPTVITSTYYTSTFRVDNGFLDKKLKELSRRSFLVYIQYINHFSVGNGCRITTTFETSVDGTNWIDSGISALQNDIDWDYGGNFDDINRIICDPITTSPLSVNFLIAPAELVRLKLVCSTNFGYTFQLPKINKIVISYKQIYLTKKQEK